MSQFSPSRNISQRVGIVGAGPAGITAAYVLSKAGCTVDVYEADTVVGGMAKTVEMWGQKVDLGPHRFFSSDPRVNALWRQVVGDDYVMVNRLTRIFYKERFYHYPLKPFDALMQMGLLEAVRCVGSYLREKILPTPQDGTFESWVTQRFGRRLYGMFFKTYSEKLWGIPCTDLDADFARQRIKKLSLSGAILNALTRGRGNTHKTLLDQFGYPHGGAGQVYDRMADKVAGMGGQVLTSSPVDRVVVDSGKVAGVRLSSGQTIDYDHVVSTMPLPDLVEGLGDVPQEILDHVQTLKYRNTILVYLRVDAEDLFPDNWLYIHSPDLLTGRITNFRNWCSHLHGQEKSTIIALEYWCNHEEALWEMDDDALIRLGQTELAKTGLLGEAEVLEGRTVRIEASYPIYSRGYARSLRPVESYLDAIDGLSVIGRGGAFKYNNQDHSILMGLLAAENILGFAEHNLWNVNTDDEYQEDTPVNKTGMTSSLNT